MVPQLQSPKRLEALRSPEKENSFPGLEFGSFQRKCAEISASLSQPSLGDRVRAEAARGDVPLPSTSTVLTWSPSFVLAERSPLQDCTLSPEAPKQRHSPQRAQRAPAPPTPAPLVSGASGVPRAPRWCLPEFEDLRRKMQTSISALQRSNAQQAEMQAALEEAERKLPPKSCYVQGYPPCQALRRGESFKEEAQEAKRSKDRHHHKWCALDQE